MGANMKSLTNIKIIKKHCLPVIAMLVAVLVTVNPGSTNAADSEMFTAEQCIEHALANSPVLAIAETDVTAAEGLITEAQAAQQLTLKLSAAARHYDQNRTGHMGAAPGAEQFYDTDLNEMQLQLRQMIWDSGRAQAKLNASRNIRDARASQKLRIEQELLFSVLLACIDVVNQQAVIEAVIQNIEDVNAALARIRKLEEVGKVANVDVLRVEVREQEIYSQKEAAVHTLNSNLARLARICGMPQTPEGIASDSIETIIQFPEIKPEEYLTTALAQRPDLLAQKAKLEAARYEKKAATTGNQPILNVVVSGNQYGNDGGKAVNNGFAGLELGWQFSDGGFTRARKKIATANKAGKAKVYGGLKCESFK
ncbi:MAG: TolC family protein, partial [Erysipelotrichia bacterium]|nr:TolC family protein [Erysipelotrichia bacterium]